MSSLINFFKNNPKLGIILGILLVFLIAYGQILNMYFWQDDFALLFKLQNPEGPAGSYGAGIIGQGPYKYFITMFVPFFPIFGMNPFGYYLTGFLMCAIEIILFYFIVKELFLNTKAAVIASFIFAAGYIGSDTLLRISNLWQTNVGMILALLSLLFYVRFLHNSKDIKNYLLGLLFYFSATEFVYVRSHSLIAPIIALDLLILTIPFKIKKIIFFLLRLTPFVIIFYLKYLKGGTVGGGSLTSVVSQLLSGKLSLLATFFADIGNTLVSNKLQEIFLNIFPHNSMKLLLLLVIFLTWVLLTFLKSSFKTKIIVSILLLTGYLFNSKVASSGLYWYRLISSITSGAIGIYLSILVVSFSLILWRTQKKLAISLILGFIILTTQIFSYYIKYPNAIFGSTHRYLSYAFVGYCLIYGALVYFFFEIILKSTIKPKVLKYVLTILPLGLIIFPNLIFGFNYQKNIIETRSKPTRNFYQQLTKFVPAINKGAIFYFDINPDERYQQQFRDFFSVGSMPNQTALATFYNVDRYDLSLITDLNELFFRLSDKENSIDDIYSFYFGEGLTSNISQNSSLVDTGELVRNLLKNGSQTELLKGRKVDDILLFENISTSPSVPVLLTLKLKVKIDPQKINKAYQTRELGDENTPQNLTMYLLNRKNFYNNVGVTSLSEWKYQEIYNAIDDNLNTSWRGSRIYWHDNKHEQITLDLKSIENISQVVWTNWNNTLSPTAYTINVSLDNKNWETVKRVTNGPERKNGEVVSEKFDAILARFVRMDITSTVSNDAPALKEIEVINSENEVVDIKKAFKFAADPFTFATTQAEIDFIISQMGSLAVLNGEIETNKLILVRQLFINSFGVENTYEFVFFPGGTNIEYININTNNLPVDFNLVSASIRNLSFSEIQERKLIKYILEK